METKRLALRGDLLDFTGAPTLDDCSMRCVRFRPDHWLLIENGRITGAQPAEQEPDPSYRREDHSGRIIMPGFIDTHVHMPQIDVIGAYGAQLLDWLNYYTFPAEMAYADPEVAEAGAQRFLEGLLSHGTTSALVYPTVHKHSADKLFAAAEQRNMRMITGKIMMDRNAPPALCDESPRSEEESRELAAKWHGRGRNSYCVTVRFAPTSTQQQLEAAAKILQDDPSLYMQTHVAENRNEVKWVSELFPEARSYLDVYQRSGLLHRRSVLGHAIWLDEEDRRTVRETGAIIAHCPSSNFFLGSGLFDWQANLNAEIPVTLATDVGAGTSLCQLRTMGDAYKVQAMLNRGLTAWCALYSATLGTARALGLSEEIGSLEAGRLADVCAWDLGVGPVAERRLEIARELHEKMFFWVTMGDERNLAATYIAGERLYQRDADAGRRDHGQSPRNKPGIRTPWEEVYRNDQNQNSRQNHHRHSHEH